MKTALSVLFLLLFSVLSYSQSGSVRISEPIKYNDYIVAEQNEIGESLLDLMDVINDETSTEETAMFFLGKLNTTIALSIGDLENLEKMNNDYDLKKSALDLFNFYKRIMGNTYPVIIRQLYSEIPDIELINKLTQEVAAEEKGYDDAFQKAQQSFSSANGFSLTPNTMQDQINGTDK